MISKFNIIYNYYENLLKPLTLLSHRSTSSSLLYFLATAIHILIYFYNWIHDKWSYTITKKQAKETMIGKYLQVFLEEHFPNSKDGLLNWFKNFLGELN